MKKISLWLLFITFFSAGSYGQQKVFSCDYTGLIYERFSTSIIPNKEKDFFIFSLITDRSIKRYYSGSDKNIGLLEQHIPAAADDPEFMYHSVAEEKFFISYRRLLFAAGIYRDKKIIEVLRSRINADMYIFETDLVSGVTTITDTIECRRSEMIINCIDYNGELNMVTYVDHTNVLNVYQKPKDGRLKKTHLTIKLPGDESNDITIISKKHFGVYDNNQRYHVLFTSARDKAFIQKDRLIFTFTSKNEDVYAAILDIGKATYTVKHISPPGEPENKIKRRSAFLIDSLLITCYATEKKLSLTIFNLNTEQLLLSKMIDENNIDQFWSEPIQRTGSFTSKSDMKESPFEKFYRTIKNNGLSVTGYTVNGRLFLSFGSEYKQVMNGTSLLNIVTSLTGTYFINASGDYYGYFISGFQGVRNNTYTSFDATLTIPGFKQDHTLPNYSVWDRMASFATMKRLTPAESKYFYMNNYYYLGYFDDPSKKFIVNRFDEKGVQ